MRILVLPIFKILFPNKRRYWYNLGDGLRYQNYHEYRIVPGVEYDCFRNVASV